MTKSADLAGVCDKGKGKKRGRPPMDNEYRLRDLGRRLAGIANYWAEKRKPGVKHEDALREAARQTTIECGLPMSKTELRRILAQMQPKGYATVWTVDRRSAAEVDVELLRYPEGSIPRTLLNRGCLTAGFGPRPSVPRSNAKKKASTH